MKKKLGVFLSLLLVTLFLSQTVFADDWWMYNANLPAAGGHTNLGPSEPKPTTNYCGNHCMGMEVLKENRLWDFWVDQVNNGQIAPTTTIGLDQLKIVQYNKTLNNNGVQGRASTRSLFDSSLWVDGLISYATQP